MAVTESDKQYGAALKELRKKHKLIQYTMAAQLGLESQQQYSYLEKGKKHFTDEIIIRICSFFRISILDFVKQVKHENRVHFLSEKDQREIMEAKTAELKLTLYKKLFLESKIENIEASLRNFQTESQLQSNAPGKHKIHVLI
ncbi:MAG TPA: helix-turn-helix transcriptional regulator [Bacteroidia bacterium]|nr:helix-turn-helix transcriptional regulator [Bacteroidia bacterium]